MTPDRPVCDQVSVFERHTDRYDDWFDAHPSAYRSELRAVREALPSDGRTGLEIGVGTGRFAAPLGVRFGIDPSPAMLTRARQRGISVAAGVAEAIPARTGALGLVLMVTTICFLEDEEAAATEMARVLHPGGIAVVGFVDAESRLGRRYREERSEHPFYRSARFVTSTAVESLLRSHGFRDIQFLQTLRADPEELGEPEPVATGTGEGGFVVARGTRPET